jgi:hypothetical protein
MLFALHRFSSHPALLVTMVQCEEHCTLLLALTTPVRIRRAAQITLPRDIREAAHLEDGD